MGNVDGHPMTSACATGVGMSSFRRPIMAMTMMEILIVISVIAVLAGMLMPMLSVVRRQFDGSKCASQMAQFGTAITSYCADWQGNLPSRRMLAGYRAEDQLYGPDGIADADYFFEGYLNASLILYAKAYRTVEINPYMKCPAMLKLNPVAVTSGQTARNWRDYRFTYQPSSSLSKVASTGGGNAVSSRMALLFCGSSRPWEMGTGSALGSSPNLVPPPPSDPLGAPQIPQFPHGADPLVPDYSPSTSEINGSITVYKLWYKKGKCNVLKRDGSVHLGGWYPAGQNGYEQGSSTSLVDNTRFVPVNSSSTSFTINGALAEYWSGTSNNP